MLEKGIEFRYTYLYCFDEYLVYAMNDLYI